MTTTPPDKFTQRLRDDLVRMANASDRSPPVVFAGREDEFRLLDNAVQGTQRGENGRTVVIKGVPGAGKTALLEEYATRLLTAEDNGGRLVVPVPLQADDLDVKPESLIQEIDVKLCDFNERDEWRKRLGSLSSRTSLAVDMLVSAVTRKRIGDFLKSAKSPHSIRAALEDYTTFRFDKRHCTFVLLVDEAQNLNDTDMVKRHLRAFHAGVKGKAQILLACFGLGKTDGQLADLGLSRLAQGHSKTISTLPPSDAKDAVYGTIERMVDAHRFDDDEHLRDGWIESATETILSESACFPHHLTNGCHALARILLQEGIGRRPPIDELVATCAGHKREYYEARLRKWSSHTTALACAFGASRNDGWVSFSVLEKALMASDNRGHPVKKSVASQVVQEMCDHGYIQERVGECRPALPSLNGHFKEVANELTLGNEVALTIRAAIGVGRELGWS